MAPAPMQTAQTWNVSQAPHKSERFAIGRTMSFDKIGEVAPINIFLRDCGVKSIARPPFKRLLLDVFFTKERHGER